MEWCSKNGHQPPKGRKYRIKIDRESYVVEKECLTGRELLELAGKNPYTRFQLNQKLKVKDKVNIIKINYDETVCFSTPGIEKFMTLPLDQTEGESQQRDFTLLEEDEEFLNGLCLNWEAIIENNIKWVFIHEYPVPKGYNHLKVTIAIRMLAGYPQSQLDMVYINPPLARIDAQPVSALSLMTLKELQFQQWSRHRTGQNGWRPGLDNLSTHVSLVPYWLEREFKIRPLHEVA
ncbi:MAG: E2/UBC family protein [bacterium]|nr:E2/UBC family protein [bacterium]